jgi:hypothetical protein
MCIIEMNFTNHVEGPLWPWLYGSWIYNYLCNQPITTDVVSSNLDQGEVYNIMW